MKAEQVKNGYKPVFRPVTIQLTFDTQEELDAFGSFFNHAVIDRACAEVLQSVGSKAPSFYAILHDAGANIQKYTGTVSRTLTDIYKK